MMDARLHHALWVGLWCLTAGSSLLFLPLVPIDETRYAGVAWEMWSRSEFLVPFLNGEPYSHKPPLLFWLMHLGWIVFGVNEWWPRLLPSLFALMVVFLTYRLARLLWPESLGTALLAPSMLIATGLWLTFNALLMFDVILTCWVLIAVLGLLDARKRGGLRGWLLFSAATALGILTKGPVMLIHVIIPASLLPFFVPPRPRVHHLHWPVMLAAGLLLTAAGALAWALPAAMHGGPEYGRAILWGQTSGRMVNAFAHQAGWWWYLAYLPLILFPWLWWLRPWKLALSTRRGSPDKSLRFCVLWTALVFLVFSLISGKRLHYLVPLLPVVALLMARLLEPLRNLRLSGPAQWPLALPLVVLAVALAIVPSLQDRFGWPAWVADLSWTVAGVPFAAAAIVLLPIRPVPLHARVLQIACVAVVAFVAVEIQVVGQARPYYDLHEISAYLRQGEREQIPIAHVGKYHGQFGFLGRLRGPIETVEQDAVSEWALRNPGGLVIAYHDEAPVAGPWGRSPRVYYPYRGRWVGVWAAEDFGSGPVTQQPS